MYERINNYISDWEISQKTGFTTSPSVLFILKEFQLKVLCPLSYQPITLCQTCGLMHVNHYNLHIIVQFLCLSCFIKYSENFWRHFFNPTSLFKGECWLEHIPPPRYRYKLFGTRKQVFLSSYCQHLPPCRSHRKQLYWCWLLQ